MAQTQSTTLFVDNLPISIRKIWVYNLFSRFGRIREIFIPSKKSKVTNQRFGFVRYYNNSDTSSAIANTNESWVWNQKLTLHLAKFGFGKRNHHLNNSGEGKQNQYMQVHQRAKKWIYRVKNPISEDQRGEKWVYRAKNPIEAPQNHFVQDNPEVVFMGAGRSNIVHNIKRNRIQPIGNGWLLRSAIAKIRKLVAPKDLEKIFSKNGVQIDSVKAMGGRFVIITFPNSEDRDKIITENWLSLWFENIKPWEGEAASEERFVWLSCYGMPLNGWAYANFKLIGDSWGQFLKVDDSTLNEESITKAKILIATNQSQRIIGCIELDIQGSIYAVRVREEESFLEIDPNLFPFEVPAAADNLNVATTEVNEVEIAIRANAQCLYASKLKPVGRVIGEELVSKNLGLVASCGCQASGVAT